MSNLRGYQWLTTVAKKVGGPRNLVLIIAGTGATVYKGGEILVKKGAKVIKKKYIQKKEIEESDIKQYEVKTPGVSNEDLAFKVDEQFKVLEADADAVSIEKIGEANNPYFASAELLREISNYKN